MAKKQKPLPPTAQTFEISYTLPEERVTQGVGYVQQFSPAERVARANAFLMKCVGFGFIAIIIPPHVIYPLIGIIAGFIGKAARKREEYAFLRGNVNCPACSSSEEIPSTSQQFPFLHFCSQCSARGEVSCTALADEI